MLCFHSNCVRAAHYTILLLSSLQSGHIPKAFWKALLVPMGAFYLCPPPPGQGQSRLGSAAEQHARKNWGFSQCSRTLQRGRCLQQQPVVFS